MPEPGTPDPNALLLGQVHVWQIPLASTHAAAAGLLEPLSQAERERARRFVFEKDQARYISARSALRVLLGRYAGFPADKIVFRYEAEGKPHLAAAPHWQFNLSHSRDAALLALARRDAVGIDLERIDPEFPRDEVAPDILAPDELREMEAMEPADQADYFFALWTMKEALLKAVGKGLVLEPREIRIRLNDTWEPEVVSAPAECLGASLFRLSAPNGFAAALALMGQAGRVDIFEYAPAV